MCECDNLKLEISVYSFVLNSAGYKHARAKNRIQICGTWPHVHKETEHEDQAQDQTYKLQLLDKKLFKSVEMQYSFKSSRLTY